MVTNLLRGLLLFLPLAILSMLVEPVMAHALYFGNRSEDIPLWFGHPEANPLGLNPGDPYDPARVEGVTAFDKTGAIIPIEINNRGDGISITPQGNIAALTASVDTGFFVVTPDGQYLNTSKREVEEYVEAFRSFQSAKGIYDWSEVISQQFGLPLEIVALKNPFEIDAAEDLPIQVLFKGQPTEGALVEYMGEALMTDNNGIASIPFKREEFQTIEASYRIPLENDPDIDELVYSTTVTVQSQSVPEPTALLGIGVFSLLVLASKRSKTIQFK